MNIAWFFTLSSVCVYFDKNISYCLDREQEQDQHQDPESGKSFLATCSLKFKAVILILQYLIYSLFFQLLQKGRSPGPPTRACTWASASCPSPVWVQSFLTVWLPTPGTLVCDMHRPLTHWDRWSMLQLISCVSDCTIQVGQRQRITDCCWKHFQIRVHQTPEEI